MKSLSVVIPSIEPIDTVKEFLPEIRLRSNQFLVEFLLVDATFQADVNNFCDELGVKYVVSSRKGRAFQMNFGASQAAHDILFFLHIDSIPPPDFARMVLDAVQNQQDCGCFRLRFAPSTIFLSFWAFFSRFHWRVARGGDQGLFLSKQLFKALGGFDESLPIMEDVEFCHRLEKQANFQILKPKIQTSSRKYMAYGQYRLQWFFIVTTIQFWRGVSPELLYKRYQKFLQKSNSK